MKKHRQFLAALLALTMSAGNVLCGTAGADEWIAEEGDAIYFDAADEDSGMNEAAEDLLPQFDFPEEDEVWIEEEPQVYDSGEQEWYEEEPEAEAVFTEEAADLFLPDAPDPTDDGEELQEEENPSESGADASLPSVLPDEPEGEDERYLSVEAELPERLDLSDFLTGSLEAGDDEIPTFVGDERMLTTEAEKDELEDAIILEAEVLTEALEELQGSMEETEPAGAAMDGVLTDPEEFIESPILRTEYLLENLVGDSTSLPSSYRTAALTPVVSQGSISACWAYAAADAGQISLLKKGIGDGSYLFSPGHLLYSAYHGGDESWGTDGASWLSLGGTPNMAVSTYLRWFGAASASEYPMSTVTASGFAMTLSEMQKSLSHLTEAVRLPYPNGEPATLTQPLSARFEAIERIRRAVYEGGAVTIDFSTRGYDSATNSIYNAETGINHEAVIVGWDNDRITAARETASDGTVTELPGAFLVKNSYGTGYGDNGYMWLSYYDCSMSRPYMFRFEDTISGKHVYKDLYAYDGTGYRPWISSGTKSVSCANVFTAFRDEKISAVGLYMPAGSSYKVQVKTGITNGDPNTGKVAATASGSRELFGFYTIELTGDVYVREGSQFAVIAETVSDGVSYAFFEGETNVYSNHLKQITTCGKGESYINISNAGFKDILSSSFKVRDEKTGSTKTVNGSFYGNACIKAYGNETDVFTVLDGVDYSAVYDYDYFLQHNSELSGKYAGDPRGALRYFRDTGMGKMLRASAGFNVRSYILEYASLRRKYGTSWKKYYEDYMKTGQAAGRHGTGCTKMKNALTSYGGVNYKYVYDYQYYADRYKLVKTNYRYDDYGAIKHFVTYGMPRMQIGIASFNVKSYILEYPSLRRLYGTNWAKYYWNYALYGKRQGRHGTGCTKMVKPVTVYNGKNYSKEYDFFYYTSHYPSVKAKFQYDDYGALKNYVTYGKKHKRKGKK